MAQADLALRHKKGGIYMGEAYGYGIISLSTVMFGLQFFFTDMFRRSYGNSFRDSLVSRLGGSVFGLIALLALKGWSINYGHYDFIMALIANINGFVLSYCSLKALGKINLSLYSLFMMLGGMTLPFLSGILLHGETLTVGKLLCFAVITVALIFATKSDGEKNGFNIYYIGIFVLNGLSGVISTLYKRLPYERISDNEYSVLMAIISIVITGIMLLFVKGERKRLNVRSIIAMAGSGSLNKVANWMLLLSLAVLPASAQYTFITGGTIIVSTVIGFFTDKKPNKREVIAVIIAFVGILLLVAGPQQEIFSIKPLIGGSLT